MAALKQVDDVGLRLRGKERPSEPREDILGTLIAMLGRERVLLLIRAFGGMRVYVPVYAKEGSRIASVAGLQVAKALTERFGGGAFRLPLAKSWLARVYREQGWSYGRIAHALGSTETSVHRWLRESGMTNQQARSVAEPPQAEASTQ